MSGAIQQSALERAAHSFFGAANQPLGSVASAEHARTLFGALELAPTLVSAGHIKADEVVSGLIEGKLWDYGTFLPTRTLGISRDEERTALLGLMTAQKFFPQLSPLNKGLLHIQIGVNYGAVQENVLALTHLNAAMRQLATCPRENYLRIHALSRAAIVYGNMGDFEKALNVSEQALQFAREADPRAERHLHYTQRLLTLKEYAAPISCLYYRTRVMERAHSQGVARQADIFVSQLGSCAAEVHRLSAHRSPFRDNAMRAVVEGNYVLLRYAMYAKDPKEWYQLVNKRSIEAGRAVEEGDKFSEARALIAQSAAEAGLGNVARARQLREHAGTTLAGVKRSVVELSGLAEIVEELLEKDEAPSISR